MLRHFCIKNKQMHPVEIENSLERSHYYFIFYLFGAELRSTGVGR